ncbi:hypothetical protein CL634_01930 [bacterium]|nr:hypothetical protein [bacterium]|tara:strand:- start:108 stop:1019 length:912 start_codon:yes stop_codon:yes gene_type:complete
MPGHIIVYKAIQDDDTSYWEVEFPIDTLKLWALDPITFASQYQSSPINLSGNSLKMEWLHFYHVLEETPEVFEKIVFFIDPAISQKKTADYFALAVAGRTTNRIYLLDLLRTRAPLEAQVNIIHDKFSIWNPDEIVIEAGGQQLYFVEHVQQNTMYNISIPDKNWHRSDKKTKFESGAAHFNSSRALLPGYKDDLGRWNVIDAFKPFMDEWASFPDGIHDDTIDAVVGAIASLISSTISYSRTSPDTHEEAVDFISRMYEDVHNRTLTDEEKQALEDYYDGNQVGRVRKIGMISPEERISVRI